MGEEEKRRKMRTGKGEKGMIGIREEEGRGIEQKRMGKEEKRGKEQKKGRKNRRKSIV